MNHTHRHFICARVDALGQYVEKTKTDYPDYLGDMQLRDYLDANCQRYLISMGSVMEKDRPVTRRTFEKMQNKIMVLRGLPYFSNAELTMDNGGYQIQQGFIPASKLEEYAHRFYDFLRNTRPPIDWTFTLDFAPGKENVFMSESELALLNQISYTIASKLPQPTRSRVIYIEHFRNLLLLRTWGKLRQMGLAAHFSNYGTGGLASSKKRRTPPCVDYVIPLVRTLCDVRKRGLGELRYHVLGASQLQYFLAHSLFEHHIRQVHGIQIEITCDSTIIFSKFARSYSLPVIESSGSYLYEISLRSGDLNITSPCGVNNLTAFANCTHTVFGPYGIRSIGPEYNLIYRQSTGRDTLTPLAYTYGMLLYLNTLQVVEVICRNEAAELYNVFMKKNENAFITSASSALLRISTSRPSPSLNRAAGLMAKRLYNSLIMLTKLDWDYSMFLVDRCLN